jgi:hypothetical protein
VLTGSTGKALIGAPELIAVKLTGIHPVPFTARDAAVPAPLLATFSPPVNPQPPITLGVEVTQPVVAVSLALLIELPLGPEINIVLVVLVLEPLIHVVVETSVAYKDNELLSVAKSETRFESLAWRKSSAGFKVKMTTTAKIAMIAITTRSSMRVNPFCFLLFFITMYLRF